MSWILALSSRLKMSSRAAWKASKRIVSLSPALVVGCLLLASLWVGGGASVTAETPSPAQQAIYCFPIQPAEATQYGPGHHDYPAVDIFAPKDSLFVSPVAGRIDELSREDQWNSKVDDPALRGGRFVSIVGDDGVRYYGSHLDAVATGLEAGMRVQTGETLGYVGTSGNDRGGKPQLHFGISYPTFPGDWKIRRGVVSPYPYLKAWQRGENLTPVVESRAE